MIRPLARSLCVPLASPLYGQVGGVVNVVAPVITAADTMAGTIISVSSGTWAGDGFSGVTYQWTRDGASIAGATSATYTLDILDMGADVACIVSPLPGGDPFIAGPIDGGSEFAMVALFDADRSLVSRKGPAVEFSRLSGGTFIDSDGVLKFAKENQFPVGNLFTSATWTKDLISAPTSGQADPFAGTAAFRVVPTASTGNHRLRAPVTGGVEGQTYAFSIYLKADGIQFVQLLLSYDSQIRCNFDLVNGTSGGAGTKIIASGIESAGGGWHRVWITFTPTGAGAATAEVVVGASLASAYMPSVATNGAHAYFAYGAQYERASAPSVVQLTTAAAYYAPRFDHRWSGSAWVCRGLLSEDQRTNLITQSTGIIGGNVGVLAFATISAVTAGVMPNPFNATVAMLTDDSTLNTHVVGSGSGHGVVSGQAYTYSIFLKKGSRRYVCLSVYDNTTRTVRVDLDTGAVIPYESAGGVVCSSDDMGNGWYRCRMTLTVAASTIYVGVALLDPTGVVRYFQGTSNSTVYLFGGQLEAGGGHSSYIPTGSAMVTRSADTASVTGASFTALGIAAAGTVVAAGTHFDADAAKNLFHIDSGADANRYSCNLSGTLSGISGGSTVFNFSIGGAAAFGVQKRVACAFEANDFAASADGADAETDGAGAVPTGLTSLRIGMARTADQINGHVRHLMVAASRVPNDNLKTLTGGILPEA